MKTLNTQYSDKLSLIDFCKKNAIPNSNKVLLQIFTGVLEEEYILNLLDLIKEILPNIQIIGSTTDGEIIDSKVLSFSTVLSFMIFDHTEIKIYTTPPKSNDYNTGKNLIEQFENLDQAKVAIIFADGLHTNGELFLEPFYKLAPHLKVAGGLSGDNATFVSTYIFTKDGLSTTGAVAAVLYNPNLIVNTSFSFGWEDIGQELIVTKASNNVVYTIDNMSATETYNKYLGNEIEQKLPATGIEFPLIINRNGDKIARAVIGKNDDGSLVFAGNINTGDKVHLGFGNIDTILENRFALYKELSQKPVETILIYSCMARKRLLGADIINEILPLSKVAPTVGFFTYGEFYFCGDGIEDCQNHLFNQTMTVMTLSESNNSNITIKDQDHIDSVDNVQTIKALSHLISITSKEVKELNKKLEQEVRKEVASNIKKDQQLIEQSKMANLGSMIGNIAHQWRQPLSSISVIASSIQLEHELGIELNKEKLIKDMDSIKNKTIYLSDSINTFRDFLKDKKELQEVYLEDIINKALMIVGLTLKDNGIKLQNSISSKKTKITLMPGELTEVIINIVNNAKDALLEKKIEDAWVKLSLSEIYDGTITISIEDNAGGIPNSIIDNIYDEYFTTKEDHKGTGLGLHMSHKMVSESLNGKLFVKNTHYGAKFHIELPL